MSHESAKCETESNIMSSLGVIAAEGLKEILYLDEVDYTVVCCL